MLTLPAGLKWDRDNNLVDTLTTSGPIVYLIRQNHKTGKWYGRRCGPYVYWKEGLPKTKTQEHETESEARAVIELIAVADHEFIQEEYPWLNFDKASSAADRRGSRAWDLWAGEIRKL